MQDYDDENIKMKEKKSDFGWKRTKGKSPLFMYIKKTYLIKSTQREMEIKTVKSSSDFPVTQNVIISTEKCLIIFLLIL